MSDQQFREQLAVWLSRENPERGIREALSWAAVLCTDRGVTRTENQDRVAAIKLRSTSNADRVLMAVAIADGMGGMREGGNCASLTLANFFFALVHSSSSQALDSLARTATLYANEAVFRFARGAGGATLSAILIDHRGRTAFVNVGDSRIYSFSQQTEAKRLTVDDSLEEAVGGHGRELLQFIGMGAGLRPHTGHLDDARNVALTSDGIHFLNQQTLSDILNYAPDNRTACERMAALARWSGGPDNASLATVDVQRATRQLTERDYAKIQLWDPFGNVQFLDVRPNHAVPKLEQADLFSKRGSENSSFSSLDDQGPTTPSDGEAKRRKPSKRKQPRGERKKNIKVEVEVSRPAEGDDRDNEDSR